MKKYFHYNYISFNSFIVLVVSLVLFFLTNNEAYAGCTQPATPISASASAITSTGVTINGTGGGPNGFFVQICGNPGGGCLNWNGGGGDPNGFYGALPVNLTGLACNTVYYVNVYGYNAASGGCLSANAISFTFQTLAGACTVPPNDNCASATLLTNGGPNNCFNTANSTIDPASEGQCQSLTSSVSCHYESVWYVFEATSAQSTITLRTTTSSTYNTDLVAFGPYASEAAARAACHPGGGNIVTNGGSCITDFDDIYDPVFSTSFPSTAGSFYLIQVINEDCNAGVKDYAGCIEVDPTPANNQVGSSAGIDACGVVYNGTNRDGYSPSRGLPGNENLDNNAGTTCPTCSAGEEVPYIINNDSWFTFCASAAGTWQVNFSGIAGCLLGNGLQMSIFKGTPAALTWMWHASSPSAPGSNQNSPNLVLAAGECVYMVVDGFAGDQCNYQYTLTNITGGCNLVPLNAELLDFIGFNVDEQNQLVWQTASEENSDYFIIEKSVDGSSWEHFTTIDAAGYSSSKLTYNVYDQNYRTIVNYYRLSQYDVDGTKNWSETISIDNRPVDKDIIKITNILGQEIPEDYQGVVLYYYSDGTIVKTYKAN